jgi:hypothetical protein
MGANYKKWNWISLNWLSDYDILQILVKVNLKDLVALQV